MKTNTTKVKRIDTEANGGLIRLAYLEILKEKKGKRPTVTELSEKTGLHSSTIKNHLKSLSFSDLTEELQMWRLLTDDVVISIYKAATQKLNPAAMKLWMQVVEGWNEKTEHKVDAKIEIENKPPVIVKFSRGKEPSDGRPTIFIK